MLFVTVLCASMSGQEENGWLQGSISYVNSSSVYVKFNSTSAITIGDTIYFRGDDDMVPALVVKHLSSISAVCEPIADMDFQPGTEVAFKRPRMEAPDIVESRDTSQVEIDLAPPVIYTPEPELVELETPEQSIRGRLALSWYGNFYDEGIDDIQRMRYVLTLNARNIGGSKVSAETYLSFRHTFGEWGEVQADFYRWFKAYNLSVTYEPNRTMALTLGRKINRYISNIGAIDGLQFHKSFTKFSVGAFAGFRPDHRDYSFNPDLLQFGVYSAMESEVGKGKMLNTLSLVQQFRSGATDRRFLYFQHTNSIFRKVYVFTSFEFDLFQNINGSPETTLRLSSLYLSARYRVSSKLGLFLSYDARNNIIYYETYKNTIDRLIEEETRQGLRLRLNLRPIKRLTVGLSGSYRFQAANSSRSRSLYGYVSYSQIPVVKVTISANTTYLKTDYLEGNIYGVRLSRDIIKGKVFADVQFRYVNYKYSLTQSKLKQKIGGTSVTWRIQKKTSLSVFYEGLFSDFSNYNRLHVNLTYRF